MSSLRTLRVIWIGFLTFVLGLTWLSDRMARPYSGHFRSEHWMCIGGAIWAFSVGILLAGKVRNAVALAAEQGNLALAARRWQSASITTWASANSIALFGFVAAMVGSPEWFIAAFDVVAALLLLLFRPVQPACLRTEY